MEDLADWTEAARFFWEKVVSERSVSFGGNSAFEHFHPASDFSRMLHGPKVLLTKRICYFKALSFAYVRRVL